MKRKKQNAVGQDVKESAREAASRVAGIVLCSDFGPVEFGVWHVSEGSSVPVCVTDGRDTERLGEGGT